jgi:hypothetical protein
MGVSLSAVTRRCRGMVRLPRLQVNGPTFTNIAVSTCTRAPETSEPWIALWCAGAHDTR